MVYYLDMASIIGKKQDGKTYYFLVESARVSGKPRIVSQRYLGPADEIMARLAGDSPGEPTGTRHRLFGDLAATWSILQRLGVMEIIDDVVGSCRSDAKVSVGTYIALATLNRVVAPCSKLAFSQWWATTAGDRLVRLSSAAKDHRRFWDAMDTITEQDLVEIERRITTSMVENFDVDISGLVLDMTNFSTYIDSANERAPIAQRGRAKQKRHDLRLVGLGLVVTTDHGIPLVSHAYGGNRPDVTQFADVVTELTNRFSTIGGIDADLTVVFDAGQDSETNMALISGSSLHFVGSIPPSDHPELLAVKASRYQAVDEERFPGVRAFEARADAFGSTWRVIVTHSENFHVKQARGFAQTLSKATRQLDELKARLARGKTRKSKQGVEAEIASIVKPRWVNRVVVATLTGETPKDLALSFRIDKTERAKLEDEIFGKRILFTDREDWPMAEVIAAYRSQFEVEADFRQMKDPHVVSFSPMFHWTDSKIRVHVFYCVLALTVARLMAREASRAKCPMSVRRLLSTLNGIQETVLLYKGDRGRPRAHHMLTEMDPIQQKLYDLFSLDTYAPKR